MRASADFRPRMQSQTQALRTLEPLAFRQLSGAVADVWSVHGEADGGGHYLAPDPRVVIFLDDGPPPMALTTGTQDRPARVAQAFYIPSDVPLWSRMQSVGRMTHLDFHLDAAVLQRRLAAGGLHHDLSQPRLLAASPELVTIGRLAAAEIKRPGNTTMLLDGLLTAALAAVFSGTDMIAPAPTGGLAPWQLAAVERYVRANLSRQVSVAEMAGAARLSESWFAHSFRQETGESPQRWLAALRLQTAKDLIAGTDMPLAAVAHVTGFADQAHLSRSFRTRFGQTPTAWRKQQLRSPVQMAAVAFKTGPDF
jgi:AraC family transcriptional regulator